jgi:glycosyltransferase involved in cell wall biosynthesis
LAKFIVLTHIYPPAIDGGSQIIYHLSEYLKSQGHQTTILTTNCASTDDFVSPHAPPVAHPKSIYSLAVYRRFYKLIGLIQKIFPVATCLNVLKTGPIFKFIPLFKAVSSILSLKADYILTGPLPTTTLLYAQFLNFLSGLIYNHPLKIIVVPCFHHRDLSFQNPILLSALTHADFIAALTDFETQYLSSHLNTKAKIFTLGAGVPASLLIKKPAKFSPLPNLLFLGNFAAHKGIITLLDAFALVKKKFPQVSLTLAGQSTLYYPQIKAHFQTLPVGVKTSIRFVTRRYHTPQLIKMLDSCALLVLPSIHESFGLVLIEAWARKKPVVVANIPAPASLVNTSGGGVTCEPLSATDLACQINTLLPKPDQLRSLGQNGYAYVKSHFTWDKIGQCLLSNLG